MEDVVLESLVFFVIRTESSLVLQVIVVKLVDSSAEGRALFCRSVGQLFLCGCDKLINEFHDNFSLLNLGQFLFYLVDLHLEHLDLGVNFTLECLCILLRSLPNLLQLVFCVSLHSS